jgi:hypothetical protein
VLDDSVGTRRPRLPTLRTLEETLENGQPSVEVRLFILGDLKTLEAKLLWNYWHSAKTERPKGP